MAMNVLQNTRAAMLAASTLAALSLFGAARAHAELANGAGWYVGIDGGRSDVKPKEGGVDSAFGSQGLATSSSIDKHDNAYSVDFGFRFNRWFAVEGRYVDFGKFDYDSAVFSPAPGSVDGRFKAHGVAANAVGIVPLPEGFAVFGKAGLVRSRAELDAESGNTPVSNTSHSRTGTDFGVGASYDFTKNFAAQVEWDRYLKVGDAGTTGRTDIDLVTAGITYRF